METGYPRDAMERGLLFTDYSYLVPFAIIIYDHMLTFQFEVDNIGVMLLNFGDVATDCTLSDVILGLRIYVMYNFGRIVLACLCAVGFITITLAVWSIVDQTWISSGLSSCQYGIQKSTAIRMAGAWEAQFVCDVTVFTFTVVRSYRQGFKIPGSILDFMVHDGAMYFAVLALANLANILMYYIGDPWTAASLSWFTSTISVTMICRLMLNLHEAADIGIFTEHSTILSIQFAHSLSDRDDEESVIEDQRSRNSVLE
ncbi:hypothetical protein C8J57DRAFT_1495036 [Mycena rebaudengoi]|nr:hypothetical protein C8J57DRAFT_1495036 [Mycena rebaudengoi]